MSTSNLRLVAVGLSFIVAVLTGVLTGFAGANEVCASSNQTPPANEPQQQQSPSPDGGTNQDGLNKLPSPNGGGQAGGVTVQDGCTSDYDEGAAAVAFGGALVAGLLVGFLPLLSRRPVAAPSSGIPAPSSGVPYSVSGVPYAESTGSHKVLAEPSAAAAPADPDGTRLSADRGTLVQTCIYVRDRATSKAIADRLAWALREVGVNEIQATGKAFDPARFEAGGTAGTDNQQLDGTVAAVEVTGYSDRGTVVRAPVVTVYRAGAR